MTNTHFIFGDSYAWNSHVFFGTTGAWDQHEMGTTHYAGGIAYDDVRKAVFANLNGEITRYNGSAWTWVGSTGTGGYDYWLFAYGGNLYVIHWEGTDIATSIDGGASWTALGSFLPGEGEDEDYPMPDFVLDSNGVIHGAWWTSAGEDEQTGDWLACTVHYASTSDWGVTWDNLAVLSGPSTLHSGLSGLTTDITSDGTNVFVLACAVDDDDMNMVMASHDGGKTWGGTVIMDLDTYGYPQSLAVSPDALHVFCSSIADFFLEAVSPDVNSGEPGFSIVSSHDVSDLAGGINPQATWVYAEKYWPSEVDAGRNVALLATASGGGSYVGNWYYWKSDGTVDLMYSADLSGANSGWGYLCSGEVGKRLAGVWIM